MKILIDHGAHHNLGDIAILEGAVIRLHSLFPQMNISVVNRANLETRIWKMPNVSKYEGATIKIPLDNLIEEIPFFWRYDDRWRKQLCNYTLRRFSTSKSACRLPITANPKSSIRIGTLGGFCDPFDALLISGGGNLSDTFHRGGLFPKCCLMQAFIEQSKSVVLTGQQIGPFNSMRSRLNLFSVLRKVNFVGLRDPGDSFTLCKESKLHDLSFAVMGDDSFGLPPVSEKMIEDLLKSMRLKQFEFLAVQLRWGSYTTELNDNFKKIIVLLERVQKILKMPLLIIPISYNSGDNDVRTAKKIIASIKSSSVNMLELSKSSPDVVKGILGKAYGAIGTSYHFCTFSLSEGTPAVCIYGGKHYSQKAKGLCLFWEDPRLGLDITKVGEVSASEHIENLFKDGDFRSGIKIRAEKYIRNWKHDFDRVVKKNLS